MSYLTLRILSCLADIANSLDQFAALPSSVLSKDKEGCRSSDLQLLLPLAAVSICGSDEVNFLDPIQWVDSSWAPTGSSVLGPTTDGYLGRYPPSCK